MLLFRTRQSSILVRAVIGAPSWEVLIKIALIHSFYSSRTPSGENRVVEAEFRALQRAGHDVRLYAARTDDLEDSTLYSVSAATRVATGLGRAPLRLLQRYKPDLVHIHNLFPNLASRWVGSLDVPVVATLHNFRPLCANGLLFRDGRTCTLCPDGHRFAGVRYGCYRDSRIASLPIAIANRQGPRGDPVLRDAQRLIVLSTAARDIYTRAGVPPGKLTVWPNFLPSELDPGWTRMAKPDAPWLFVGRLSREKGIVELVRAWPRDRRLIVIGEGDLRPELRDAARGKAVQLVGLTHRSSVIEAMRGSLGLVVPSLCLESFPMVYTEALAVGLPVLAWESNVVASLVTEHGSGETIAWNTDLPAALDRAGRRFAGLRAACRKIFETELSEPAYIRRAEDLYSSLL